MTTKYSQNSTSPMVGCQAAGVYDANEVDPYATNYTTDFDIWPTSSGHALFVCGYYYSGGKYYPVISPTSAYQYTLQPGDFVDIGLTYNQNDYYVGVWSNSSKTEYQLKVVHNFKYVHAVGVGQAANQTLSTPSDYNALQYTEGWNADMYPYPANHSHLNLSGGVSYDIVGFATEPYVNSVSTPVFMADSQPDGRPEDGSAQAVEYVNYFHNGYNTAIAYVAVPVEYSNNWAFQIFEFTISK